MKKYYIYKITNKINGKFYIGQTVNLARRFNAHTKPSTVSAIGLAIKAHGGHTNFDFEVIDEVLGLDEANRMEMYYIKTLDCMAPKGYNLDEGGTNAIKTKESIEKGAAKKRGMAYKNRRRGIRAVKGEHVIEVEVVKDLLNYGFSKANCSNIRCVLANKTTRKQVKGYSFSYINTHANQNLIVETKKTTAVQRIGIETTNVE